MIKWFSAFILSILVHALIFLIYSFLDSVQEETTDRKITNVSFIQPEKKETKVKKTANKKETKAENGSRDKSGKNRTQKTGNCRKEGTRERPSKKSTPLGVYDSTGPIQTHADQPQSEAAWHQF